MSTQTVSFTPRFDVTVETRSKGSVIEVSLVHWRLALTLVRLGFACFGQALGALRDRP